MKIQIAATLSADGFLSSTSYQSPCWLWKPKYSIPALRKNADRLLSKDESIISLLNEEQNEVSTTCFTETIPDMLDLVKSLFLYRLVDELYVYVLSGNKKNDIRLFDLTPLSEWTLIGKHSLFGGNQLLVYHRTEQILSGEKA